jgi:methionyl-tRNA formyltransferase
VKALALEREIPVTSRVADLLDADVDLGIVVAFGRLVRPEVLARVPMINVHFSLLPRWRGAAPVERAILAGDRVTGVCLMALEEGLDTGPVYAAREVSIGAEEHASELRRRLGEIGTQMLLDTLASGLPEPHPQVGEATYAAKIDPAELELDFDQGALTCAAKVRVGPAWTTFRGARLLVHEARAQLAPARRPAPGELAGDLVGTADGALQLLEVQVAGRQRVSFAQWANGARPEGTVLGEARDQPGSDR